MYDIIQDVKEYYQKKRQIFPCHTNRASQLGAPCLRQLVYFRTDWDKQTLPDTGLQAIFDEGEIHENAVRRLLEDCGYTVHESQRPITDSLLKKYQISGHLDFSISKNGGKPVLAEVKSMSPYIWDSTETLADFDRFPWSQKYVPQMQIYLFGAGEQEGVFILKNKSNGQLKTLSITLDLEMAEALLKKAETINQYVVVGTMPDRIQGNIEECKRCPFAHICTPDILNQSAAILDNAELLAMLDDRQSLIEAHKKYDRVDKDIRVILKNIGADDILIGDYQITKTIRETKGYTVKPGSYQVINIEKMTKQ